MTSPAGWNDDPELSLPIVRARDPDSPRFSFGEAIDFIDWCVRHADPEKMRRQKEWEERIEHRFHFPDA